MALYEGVLDGYSDSVIISTEPGSWKYDTWTDRWVAGPPRVYAGYTRRAYVDVGGTRIRNVLLTPHQDALLQESLSRPIALSVVGARAERPGSKRIMAMRTSRGVEKTALPKLVAAVVALTALMWGLAVVGGLILIVLLAAITLVLPDVIGRIGMAVVLAGALWLLILPVYTGVQALRAWSALPRARDHTVEVSMTKR